MKGLILLGTVTETVRPKRRILSAIAWALLFVWTAWDTFAQWWVGHFRRPVPVEHVWTTGEPCEVHAPMVAEYEGRHRGEP